MNVGEEGSHVWGQQEEERWHPSTAPSHRHRLQRLQHHQLPQAGVEDETVVCDSHNSCLWLCLVTACMRLIMLRTTASLLDAAIWLFPSESFLHLLQPLRLLGLKHGSLTPL